MALGPKRLDRRVLFKHTPLSSAMTIVWRDSAGHVAARDTAVADVMTKRIGARA